MAENELEESKMKAKWTNKKPRKKYEQELIGPKMYQG